MGSPTGQLPTDTTSTGRLPTWVLALIVPLVAGVAVVATALTSGDDATAPAAAAAVTIRGFTFAPDPVEVRAGETVVIANVDGVEHTFSADDGAFDSGIIDRSGSGKFTAPAPGTYTFACQIHSSMTGTLVSK